MAACATNSGSSPTLEMNIRYGEIVTFYRVSAPSVAPTGTVVEGFTGLALARNSKPRRQSAAALGGSCLGCSAAADIQDSVPVLYPF